ncbi:S4 domain-containing protein [Roseomonas sp. HF4]|uniref:S4 domain-containing protein n=1 Tax=Roseomonas sp. HF4 TaxID=2562313 RepID=UPI001F1021BE|nr:S4 domain-containing protein [Roseomonas sp. HF4]
MHAGLAASKREARRLVAQNGLRLNDVVVTDAAAGVAPSDLRDGAAKIPAGRKRHVLVRPG